MKNFRIKFDESNGKALPTVRDLRFFGKVISKFVWRNLPEILSKLIGV